MARSTKADQHRKWLDQNASAEERIAAFKAWSETQWGMPTFLGLRRIVEGRRSSQRAA